jgi:hypothetical protein
MPKIVTTSSDDGASFRKMSIFAAFITFKGNFLGQKVHFWLKIAVFLPFFGYCKPHNCRSLHHAPKYFSESLAHNEF